MKRLNIVGMAQGYLNGMAEVLRENVDFLREEKYGLEDAYDKISTELEDAEENLEQLEHYLSSFFDQ